jgi:hypothetical protein
MIALLAASLWLRSNDLGIQKNVCACWANLGAVRESHLRRILNIGETYSNVMMELLVEINMEYLIARASPIYPHNSNYRSKVNTYSV